MHAGWLCQMRRVIKRVWTEIGVGWGGGGEGLGEVVMRRGGVGVFSDPFNPPSTDIFLDGCAPLSQKNNLCSLYKYL